MYFVFLNSLSVSLESNNIFQLSAVNSNCVLFLNLKPIGGAMAFRKDGKELFLYMHIIRHNYFY